MADLVGQRVGNYLITGLLGEGGMAAVYRAHQESMGRDVAIKVIESKLARNPEFTKRFDREARTIAALSHTHILKVFEYGRQGDLIYLVMELLPGGSLADLIKRKRLDLLDAARLLDQIGDALDYAHSKGIIHRDLKPQNVLLDERGNAILTDFGIAKLLNETTALTVGGMAMGTPFYMSPEQCQGGMIDARSDLYSLGVMLFEMLIGDVPFRSDTPVSLLYMHINQPLPSVRDARPDLPETVGRVLHKALAKQPESRFQSAREMVSAFRTAITGAIPPGLEEPESPGEYTAPTPIPIPVTPIPVAMPREDPEPEMPQQPRRGILAIGLVTILLLIGIVAILLTERGAEAEPTGLPSQPAIAANPTETNAPSLTPTNTSGVTNTATMTFTSTSAHTVTPRSTQTLAPSTTPSLTPIPATVTETPNLETLVAGLAATDIQSTLNAIASFTHTPTNTYTPSPDLPATARAILNITRTAIVIASYTKTPTFTATFTRTPSPTKTFAPSATNTPLPTSTPEPFPAGIKPDWTPMERDFNGIPLVYVPAGCFMMGTPDDQVWALNRQGNTESFNDEKPVHEVCLTQGYWIGKYEITNADFQRFVDDGGYTTEKYWSAEGWAWRSENKLTSPLDGCLQYSSAPTQPRVCISWYEMEAFTRWWGGRLPTEAEWEYAARGPQSLSYPWGDDFVADHVIYEDNSGGKTAPVGSKPNGKAWSGAYDLSGNVWEWVADWYDEAYYANSPQNDPTGPSTGSGRGMKGGAWNDNPATLRAATRDNRAPGAPSDRRGFRVVWTFVSR